MSLTDPSQMRTTEPNYTYAAGQEPWNKSLDGYNIPGKDTEVNTYQSDWTKWHGLYRDTPEQRSTIDKLVAWIINKKLILNNKAARDFDKRLKSQGRHTLRKLLSNHLRTAIINGDSYAWIPRDKAGRLLNMKILGPGSIEIRANNMGIIKEYAQVTTKYTNGVKEQVTLDTWTPKEIFHTSWEQIADEIHGIPEPEKMQRIIKMRQQAMSDNALIFHNYGKPTYFFEADTDDDTELEEITAILDDAMKNVKNAVVPKGTLSKIENVRTPQFGILDYQPWLTFLRSYHTESSGVPDLVRGKSDEVSLAAGKLNLVAFKEDIIFKQIDFSENIEMQTGMEISFEEPIEIDIEISRTEEDQELKESAKREQGGDLKTTTKKTNEKKS